MATQAKATTTKASNKSITDLEFDYTKNYEFRLTSPHQGKYVLPTESRIWDDYTKRQRIIRYTDTEESPYADEQDEGSSLSADRIEFVKGSLFVSGANRQKLLYLLAYDGNADKERMLPNRNPLFRYKMVDQDKEFKDKAATHKLKIKVQNLLLEASKEELFDFLSAEYGYQPKTDTIDELLTEALRHAERDPEFVSKNFNTEESRLKSKFIQAFKDQTIINTKGVVTWADTGLEIQTFKLGENEKITDLMVQWVAKNSKEATDFIKKLTAKS